MPIGAWIIFVILAVLILVVAIAIAYTSESKAVLVSALVVAFCLCALMFFGMTWWFKNTESGKRAMKTQESNFDGGITRHVDVYDAIGNKLAEYEGKFDISFDRDTSRLLFDDEEGFRHVIYYQTGTIIVDEVNHE